VDYCGGGSLVFRSESVLVVLKLFRLLGVIAGALISVVGILRDLLFSSITFAYRHESILVIFFLFSNFICRFLALSFLGVRVLLSSPDDCKVFVAEFDRVRFFGVVWRP